MTEPTLEIFHGNTPANRVATFIAATRPAFLTASILPVLLGLALAWHQAGRLDLGLAILTLLSIVLIHGGANVLNDYCDHRNGTDKANQRRVYPFSGGSRFIQNDVLSASETLAYGVALLASGAATGLLVTLFTGPLLLLLGVLGGVLAIIYSAPPCLACRGLGDLTVGVCFGVLPVAGTVWIQLGTTPAAAWWLGIIAGIFTAAILWINSIPDIDADRLAGKLTLPARLGETYAPLGLVAMFLVGFALIGAVAIPAWSRLALLGIMPAVGACVTLFQGKFIPAMPLVIVTQTVVCLLLALGCLF